MLDVLLLVSTAAFIFAGAAVGVRLLLLANRTRQLPDFVVGFSLFVLSAIAYPLILLGAFGGFTIESARAVFNASIAALAAGWAGVFVFTLRVFRPGVWWARVLAVGGCAGLVYGLGAAFAFAQATSDLDALRDAKNPGIVIQFAALAAYVWTGTEGFLCWAQARRRLALGLADAMVVNRFLLWGVVGVCSLISVAPSLVITLAGGDGTIHPIARLCTALAGLACAIALQLAFLPPASYRRWITGASAA